MPVVVFFLLGLVGALVLAANGGGAFGTTLSPTFRSAVFAHAVLAVAALPLMLHAIQHFVPVLTRTAAPHVGIRLLPLVAGLGGISVVMGLMWGAHQTTSLWLGWGFVSVAVGGTFFWALQRGRRCLGSPHPGWIWYVTALGCLLAGLVAAAVMLLLPEQFGAAKRFHLHINLFGWIGLTIFGTLPVLWPTVLQKNDPGATQRLKSEWRWALAGVLAMSVAAAAQWRFLAAAVAVFLAWGVWRRWLPLRQLAGGRIWVGGSASLALGYWAWIAILALSPVFLLWFGTEHHMRGRWLWPLMLGALLPIVFGALVRLLPVWRWPGPALPARANLEQRLARGAPWRAGLFAVAALWVGLVPSPWTVVGLALAGVAVAHFVGVAFGLALAGARGRRRPAGGDQSN